MLKIERISVLHGFEEASGFPNFRVDWINVWCMKALRFVSISKAEGVYSVSRKVTYPFQYLLHNEFVEVLSDAIPLNGHIRCDLSCCACRINPFVWVSDSRKAIWFEIPKSASRSVMKRLGIVEPNISEVFNKIGHCRNLVGVTIFYSEEMESRIRRELFRIRMRNVLKLDLFKRADFRLKVLTPDEAVEMYPSYFSFAFLRNPFEKMISNFKMFTQHENRIKKIEQNFGVTDGRSLDFKTFIHLSTQYFNHHWENQVFFLPSKFDKVNYLGTVETIDSDWVAISKTIDVDVQLPRFNTTEGRSTDYGLYYDTHSFELVKKKYWNDIKLYNDLIHEDICHHLGRMLS